MIGVVATLTTAEGKGPDLEKVFADLAAKVKANESGCLMYQLTKSRTEPNVYKVLEMYASQDALTAHGQTEYFKAAGPSIGACLGGRPSIEYLDAVVIPWTSRFRMTTRPSSARSATGSPRTTTTTCASLMASRRTAISTRPAR